MIDRFTRRDAHFVSPITPSSEAPTKREPLVDFLVEREQPFLAGLERVASMLPDMPGWSYTRKNGVTFTGSGLCNLAAAALKDGLVEGGRIADSEAQVVGVYVPEISYPGAPDQHIPNHGVLRVRVPGDVLYVDATYGQIDPKAIGKLTLGRLSNDDFHRLFSGNRNTPDGLGNPTLTPEQVTRFMQGDGLTLKLYMELVETLL